MKTNLLLPFILMLLIVPSVSAKETSNHNMFGYYEQETKNYNSTLEIVVTIDKSIINFILDNKHIVVEYSSNKTLNWWYPIEDVISKKAYYRFAEYNDTYEIVVRFKNETTAAVKVSCFPGATHRWYEKSAFVGTFDKFWVSAFSGIKKLFVDLWNW